MNENLDLVSAVFGEKRIIAYRPELRELTKSVTANILLNQIIYRWIKNNRQEFYKFKEPCKNKKYREGDSWTEELGFSVKEFDNAIKKIGFKLGKTKNYIKKEDAFVIYRRDANGLTWYDVNWDILSNCLKGIYKVNAQRADSKYMPKGQIHNTTKNTTKTLSSNDDGANKENFSYEKYLEKMKNDKQRHIQIIWLFFLIKKRKYTNKQQVSEAIRRNLRAAKSLIGYSSRQIKETMEWLNTKFNDGEKRWTLETVGKYIDDIGKEKYPKVSAPKDFEL